MHWLDRMEVKRDLAGIGYPSKAEQWGADKIRDYAHKNGLRLPHGYKTVSRRMSGIGKAKALDKGSNRFALNSYNQVKQLLFTAGVPAKIIPWAAAQASFETNGFKSHVSTADFNLSGITWINKPYQKATRGAKRPEGGYYAHYASYKDWANDFKRVLSVGGEGAAIKATSLEDYVDRLHKNHYFTSSPGPYLQAMKIILIAAGELQKQQDKQLKDAHPEKTSWFKDHPLLTGVGLAVGGILVIKAVNR